ncbi:MAG: hypothetical protein D3923_11010 [Candidatus Electrothrix sp. AR3]|nr:hypothetical protein [Candidatus Electrothrix sp. AR3]
MYTNTGDFDSCETLFGIWYGNEVRYNKQSWGGQSGSGALDNPTGCPSCWVYAVLSNGTDTYTDDVRLTEDKFNNIKGIISQDTSGSVDLVPLDVRASSSVPAGERIPGMDYLVHNHSTTTYSGTFSVHVYLSTNDTISSADTLIQSHTVTKTIGSKSSTRVNVSTDPLVPVTLAPEHYYLGVIIQNSDANTSNNDTYGQDTAIVDVGPADPDLVVQLPTVSKSSLNRNESFSINARVKNQGYGPASSTTLRYYLSTNSIISKYDQEIATDYVTSLASGSVSDESTSGTAPSSSGTYWIGACVDTVTNESTPWNNCSIGIKITVTKLPIKALLQLLLLK